jgi:K+-sensing histidine kinase KdpD
MLRVDARRQEPRVLIGLGVGVGLVGAITAVLLPVRSHISRASPALALVIPVVVAGILGGRIAAVVTAVCGGGAFSLAFIPPVGTLRVAVSEDVVALVVFTLVAIAIGTLVAREAERRRAAEQRADQIEAMHVQFQAMVAEQERLRRETDRLAVLEQIDEQRSALLRSVSHDLRTPLAAIRAVASDLRSGAVHSGPIREELLDVVSDEAERLDRIVGNLLSLSRIETGALQPDRQAVALEELLADLARRLSRLFADVALVVELPTSLPLADVDYVQIDQVLTNLLENAVRHSPLGSTVRVGATQEGAWLRVTVSDEGDGIDPDEGPQMFLPFRTAGGSSSTGVGLAICKAIVEAHGGMIDAGNAPDGGARFEFTIPARDG